MAIGLVQRCMHTGNKMFEICTSCLLLCLAWISSPQVIFLKISRFFALQSVLADADDGNVA
jgi:hypothetical protein